VDTSGVVQEALIMRENLPGWKMQAELQRHQNSKLRSEQFPFTNSETVEDLLQNSNSHNKNKTNTSEFSFSNKRTGRRKRTWFNSNFQINRKINPERLETSSGIDGHLGAFAE